MRLRLLQTLHRRQSISTDYTRIDYEESEDEISPSSSPTFHLSSFPLISKHENDRLSSSTGIYPNSISEPSQCLHQSTPSLFHSADNTKTLSLTSSNTILSSSQSSATN
jgi:hypothetical protein